LTLNKRTFAEAGTIWVPIAAASDPRADRSLCLSAQVRLKNYWARRSLSLEPPPLALNWLTVCRGPIPGVIEPLALAPTKHAFAKIGPLAAASEPTRKLT
jgi:hypothetical protein